MTDPVGVQRLIIDVPDELAARVGAALNDAYPEVVADATTLAEAMRAVIAWWTGNLLAEHEARTARATAEQAVADAEAQLTTAVTTARSKAWATINAAMATEPAPTSGEGVTP